MASKFTQNLNLMLWKDVRLIKNNKLQLAISILLPMILGFIAVGMRIHMDVKQLGVISYSRIDLKASFGLLMGRIQSRRNAIESHGIPSPYHSVYCPQLIIGFAAQNITHYQEIFDHILSEMQDFGVKLYYYEECEEMKSEMRKEHYLFGICFKERENPRDLYYDLIVSGELRDYNTSFISATWLTASNYPLQNDPSDLFSFGTQGGPGAPREGTAFLQNHIAIAHMKRLRNDFEYININLGRFPNMDKSYDSLLKGSAGATTCTILLGYLFPSVFVVTMLISEKENGVRNYLRVKGIGLPVQLLAWCIILWCITAFSSIITAILFKIAWNNGAAIMTNITYLFIVGLLWSYCFANASFCVMVSAVCSSIHKAIPFLILCWLMSFMIFLHNPYNNPFTLYMGIQMIFCHNALTANVIHHILDLDSESVRLRVKDLLNFGTESKSFYILILSGILFFFMAWGLDYFKPGLYGSHKSFLRFCRKRKTQSARVDLASQDVTLSRRNNAGSRLLKSVTGGIGFLRDIQVSMNVMNLTKSFGDNLLFEGFNLTLHEDEMTSCIGTNRSGKTVLSLIMAGLAPYDSGSIQTQSIKLNNKYAAVEEVGLASGITLLLPDLTFMEQLIFYSRIHGITEQNSWNYSHRLVSNLGLDEYLDVLTYNIPFMPKRCLAVMCAFCGNNSIIILDSIASVFESSYGKEMCRFVQDRKSKKTIFVTARSISKADQLADRIILLEKGTIICDTSSGLLTNSLGNETVLTCVKNKNFKEKEFSELVRSIIPDAESEGTEMRPEVAFTFHEKDEDLVPELLDRLEEKKIEFGLDNLEIKQTGLEDILRRTVQGRAMPVNWKRQKLGAINIRNPEYYRQILRELEIKANILPLLKETPKVTGFHLFWGRVKALLRKQYYCHSTNKFTLIFYLLMPLILCSYAAIISRMYANYVSLPPRVLNITKYKESLSLITSSKKLNTQRSDIILYYRDAMRPFQPENQYQDLMQNNLIDYDNENYIPHNILTTGMHVSRRAITAKFNSYLLHSSGTALAQVHTAILRGILMDHEPQIEVTLVPLEPESKYIANDLSIIRFLAFCYSLGLWFVFGLSTSGVSFEQNSFDSDPQNNILKGPAFWVGFVLVTAVKLLIEIPIFLLFIMATDYREYMSLRMIFVIVEVTVLGAFYFQFVKMTFLILFYEIERKYVITIFLTIVGIIAYSFSRMSYSGGISLNNNYLIFLPLNIISRLLFFAFYTESIRLLCDTESIHHISVYYEKCRRRPNCCDLDRLRQEFSLHVGYVILIILMFFLISVLSGRFHRAAMLCTTKKIPLRSRSTAGSRSTSPSKYINSTLLELHPQSKSLKELPVLCDNVGKRVGNHDMLSNISLIIKRGECLSLIGPHLHEKTMLLRLISGDLQPSYGRILCFGKRPVNKCGIASHISFGYCLPNLGRIHFLKVGQYLEIYALSIGLEASKVPYLCRHLADYIGILDDYDKLIAIVSTSTQRKMSFIAAFIGFPQLIIADINLNYFDYHSKELMLKLVNWYLENGGTMIFSVPTATKGALLGTQIAFLARGRIQTMGTLGTICLRHANGYQVIVKISPRILTGGRIRFTAAKTNENANLKYCSFMENTFQSAVFNGRINQHLYYFIPYSSTTLANIYTTIEENLDNLSISHYRITVNTLDTVYRELTRNSLSFNAASEKTLDSIW